MRLDSPTLHSLSLRVTSSCSVSHDLYANILTDSPFSTIGRYAFCASLSHSSHLVGPGITVIRFKLLGGDWCFKIILDTRRRLPFRFDSGGVGKPDLLIWFSDEDVMIFKWICRYGAKEFFSCARGVKSGNHIKMWLVQFCLKKKVNEGRWIIGNGRLSLRTVIDAMCVCVVRSAVLRWNVYNWDFRTEAAVKREKWEKWHTSLGVIGAWCITTNSVMRVDNDSNFWGLLARPKRLTNWTKASERKFR